MPDHYVPPHLRTRQHYALPIAAKSTGSDHANYGSQSTSDKSTDFEGKLASSWEEFTMKSTWLNKSYIGGERWTHIRASGATEKGAKEKEAKENTAQPASHDSKSSVSDRKPNAGYGAQRESDEKVTISIKINDDPHETRYTVPLTRAALIKSTGAAPSPESGKKGINEAVSDAGVENLCVRPDQVEGDSRATLAPRPEALVEWDGGWAPPPPCWESERDGFQSEFIPEFIRAWRQTTPAGENKVNVQDPNFASGKSGINNFEIIGPVEQPECLPGKPPVLRNHLCRS